jgi:hypothetical protein
MNVKINIVELASELADLDLENNWMDSIKVWIEDENEDLVYTEEAQDIFNDLYDKYYGLIDRLKID